MYISRKFCKTINSRARRTQAIINFSANMPLPLRARRSYARTAGYYKRTTPYRRTYGTAYKKTYTKRTYRRASVRTYKKKKLVGPQPVRTGATMKSMRQLIANNEDFLLNNQDASQTSMTTNENMTAIGSYMLASYPDITAMFQSITPSGATGSGNYNLILKSGYHSLTFSNMDTQIQEITYWVVRAKRDITNIFLTTTLVCTPDNCWMVGVQNSGYGGVAPAPGANGGYNHPNSQPNDSSLFNQFWYVCKRRKFQLLPGAVKTIGYKLGNMPYKMNAGADHLNGYNNGPQGITMAMMWQVRGAPIANTSNAGTYPVLYARTTLAVIENKRYHYTYAADSNKNIIYNQQSGSPALVNPTYINPITGMPNNNGFGYNASFPVTVQNITSNPVPVIGTNQLADGKVVLNVTQTT